jgi:hypothetical protein
MSNPINIFGLGSLANPKYATQNATVIETSMLANDESTPSSLIDAPPPLSSQELLMQKLKEVEDRVHCGIFKPNDESHDEQRLQPQPSMQSQPQSEPIASDFDTYSQQPESQSQSQPQQELHTSNSRISTEGLRFTEEERKRDRLTSALSALSIDSNGFLDEDRERDKKLTMIEEIQDLYDLFREDGEDVARITIPTVDDSLELIAGTLKILKRHNDRRRFGTIADECIMLAATSLETLCDGNRSVLGFNPDLRGWSKHVRAKLRRMRHDTSQIASSIFNDYNIGPGTRLFIELIPNLIMYARDHSTNGAPAAQETHTQADFDNAMQNLRNK